MQFFLLANHNMAQSKIIKGVVLDFANRQVMPGVLVSSKNLRTITNESGYFALPVDSSIHAVKFSFMGYQDTTVYPGNSVDFMVYLREANYILNTSVVTASRYESSLAESTISMNVINSSMPSSLNSTGVEQLLDRVPGVQLIDGQANIRGGSGYSYGAGSRVLLMMDDLPAYVADAGFPNWDDLPIENIGQIEIVKGAASALYGSSAMNGIIHFRSAYPGSDPYTSVVLASKFYLDPGNNKAWWVSHNSKQIPFDAFVQFVHRKKSGTFDYSMSGQLNRRIGFNKNHDSETGRFHVLLRNRFSNRLTAGLGVNYNQGESSSYFYWKDNGFFEGDSNSLSHTLKLRFTIDPSLVYLSRKNFSHKILTRYYHVENMNENNQSNRSDNAYLEYQLSKLINSIQLRCMAGIVFNPSWTNAELYSDTNFYHRNLAGFLHFEKILFDKWILSAGLRYENYAIHGPHKAGGLDIESKVSQDYTIFRFATNYRLAKSSYLRASIGQGFRFPTIAEKYISTMAGGLNIVPNPALKSEYGLSYEVGIKQGLSIGWTLALFDIALFGSRYYDMMEFILNNKLQFQSRNIGNTEIKGVEIGLQSITERNSWKLSLGGGYTYIDPRYLEFDKTPITDFDKATRGQLNATASSSVDNILKYRSQHLFRFDIELSYRSCYLGLNINYASHVEAIDKVFELFIRGVKDFRNEHNTGYRVYDFRIGYQLGVLHFQVHLNNAFNENYTTRPGLMEAPRTLGMRISYTMK